MEDNLEVRINGKPYRTVIDDQGLQRFPVNKLYRHLVDTKQIDLQRLAIDYESGRFSKDELMEFYIGIGYSVPGFSEIFKDVEIENPLWDKEDK
jgi:hypothetical protein